MLWLEMSRDQTHGGEGWGFTECLWSPSRKRNLNSDGASGTRSPYWENLLRVQAGDLVLHLRDDAHGHGFFVGYSVAVQNGYETEERPPEADEWGYSPSFYRVPLTDYRPFPEPLDLDAIFHAQDVALRAYIERNRKAAGQSHRTLFCVIQDGRLQRQNGAYLSEVDEELAGLYLVRSHREMERSP
jgi:putative restriction endonuclease